jgi:hypothetical protein
MPMPSLLAGILVGLIVKTAANVLIDCAGWAFVFCAYLWIIEGRREQMAISYYEANARRPLLGSPIFTFYAIEWTTALMISLLAAFTVFNIRNMFY